MSSRRPRYTVTGTSSTETTAATRTTRTTRPTTKATEGMGRHVRVAFTVLGPVTALDGDGRMLALKGPRHREVLATVHIDLGRAAEAVADLDAYVDEHPWREDAWRLLALALYRSHRQADALAVLRRARTLLAEHLGLEPGPALRRLEADILDQARHLDPKGATGPDPASVWSRTTAAYDRAVGAGAKARLESTVALLRSLAVTGGEGLTTARRHRVAAIVAAEETGDAELTARVVGAYDVPAIWTRVDDSEQSAFVVAAAERTLRALSADAHDAVRSRLLTTIALESRGTRGARGPQAAHEAERIARRPGDPVPLAFALARAHEALAPAAAEWGGGGLLTVGPVSRYLDEITAARARP